MTLSNSLQRHRDHELHHRCGHHALTRSQSCRRNTHSTSWPLALPLCIVATTTTHEHGAPCLRFCSRTVVMEWRNSRDGVRKKEKYKPSNNKHYSTGTKGGGRKKNETNKIASFHFFANLQTRCRLASLCYPARVYTNSLESTRIVRFYDLKRNFDKHGCMS